jgi:iron complex outermembrane receptor protein
MKSLPDKISGWLRALLATVILASASVVSLRAQVSSSDDNLLKLEEMFITGSNIPTAVDAVAVPVTILGPTDLQNTGLDTNLLDVLQKRMPMFAGNGNLGTTNSNVGANATYGGSQISLRNLDTLVLLNGRRLPTSGTNARGGRNFVDVNQIPLAAVESIEILTDGASAVYGSDAVGGVVNIKLKSNFEGLEMGGRYAFTTQDDGDYVEKSAFFVAGATKDWAQVTISGAWGEVDPLYQANRSFSSPIVGRTATVSGAVSATSATFPTHYLIPSLSSPSDAVPTGTAATAANLAALVTAGVYTVSNFTEIANAFDLSPLVTLTLGSERESYSLASNFDLIDRKLVLFIDGLYSKNSSFSQLAAQPVTSQVPVGSPYNPLTSSVFAAFRYIPEPRQFLNDAELKRIVFGLRGEIGERWNWEVGYNHNKNQLTNQVAGVLYAPNLLLSIAGGYNEAGVATAGGKYARVFPNYSAPPGPSNLAGHQANVTAANTVVQPALDIFSRPDGVDPASIVHIFGRSTAVFTSELKVWDARVSGELFDMKSGPVGVAFGAVKAQERLIGAPDENSYSSGPTAGRWSGATFFNPFSRSRDVDSAFAEVRVPLASESWNFSGAHALDLTAAYRYEDYSDAGESKVPKFGIRWQPVNNEFTFRATYSEAFTAPAMFSLYGPTTQGFTATAVIPNVFGVNGQAQARGGSNADLKPSTAETFSYGFVYSPSRIEGLSIAVNYIDIDQISLVGSAGSTEILRSVNELGPASPYAAQFAIGNWPTNPDSNLPAPTFVTQPGQLATHLAQGFSANAFFLTDTLINVAGQRVKALDVTVDYVMDDHGYGEVGVHTTGTFFLDYQFQALPGQEYYEYASHVSNGGTGAQGTVPGYRFYTTLDWKKGPWSAVVGNTYIDKVEDIGPGGFTFAAAQSNPNSTLRRRHVSSLMVWDTSISYTLSEDQGTSWLRLLNGAKITIGANNVFDKSPPLAPQAFNESNVDVSTYSPLGRLVYLDVRMRF